MSKDGPKRGTDVTESEAAVFNLGRKLAARLLDGHVSDFWSVTENMRKKKKEKC